MEVPKYSDKILSYITAIQRQKLIKEHGLDFEENLSKIFPNKEQFLNHIEQKLNEEFKTDSDEKLELEAQLKNSAIDEVINLTKYEFPQHKSLLNLAEIEFRKAVNPQYLDKLPYSATLYSFEVRAEVKHFVEVDKPIIFFHSGLFSANLMFCKLFVKLIKDIEGDDNSDSYTHLGVKEDNKTFAEVNLCACYFYNYYLSGISEVIPGYDLKTAFENSILAILLNSITLFIYSHEVGHSILEHNQDEDGVPQSELWREEFEADRFAMIHLQNSCLSNRSTTAISLLGPIIYFRYTTLIETYDPMVDASSSHPPTKDRLENYLQWLTKAYPNDKDILKSFLELEHKISSTLYTIFDKINKTAHNLRMNTNSRS